MARQKGAVNYNNKVLIDVVAELLPNSNLGWRGVALAYKEKSKETAIRDGNDVKNHWMKKLCNGMKKPMGKRRPVWSPYPLLQGKVEGDFSSTTGT